MRTVKRRNLQENEVRDFDLKSFLLKEGLTPISKLKMVKEPK